MNIREIIEDLETRRKVFHLFALLLWLLPLNYLPSIITLLVFSLVIGLNLLTVLGVGKERLTFYYRFVYKLEREKNYSRPGIQALWANLGIFSVFLLFGKEPAMVSVVVLAVGDAFASVVGMRYGRTRMGSKSLEGSIAFFLSTFLVLLPFLGLWKAFLICIFSAIVEALPISVDDNFSVPLVAGVLYYML
ncbi:SEC59/DGK1/VTE5 family protein [Hydrogenobacter sp. T-2]|uniref:diacylglycerol/polyprenol kinase family protein n=1 Tax=Pampinifervens diazotrophicum TaxID=1632018 RepID=UPI002B25E233|nr:SEC59/DGK1/VTE5 family protein [Hydrogenobacter sp. T-2]WPM32200.1 SEC59/DGK1/VTE5 family protein [Hydrogenobacter sp. T-2]